MRTVGGNAPLIIRSRFTEIADGYCRQRTNSAAFTMTEGASELFAPEGIRTPNFLIRRHGRMAWPGMMRVLLSCRWRCRGARLRHRANIGPQDRRLPRKICDQIYRG